MEGKVNASLDKLNQCNFSDKSAAREFLSENMEEIRRAMKEIL
jgi:hypothetical protein